MIKLKIKDIKTWESLNYRMFFSDDNQWKKFVFQNRNAPFFQHNWDWIFGPVADGGLSKPSYLSIKAYPDMNQLSVHSKKAVDCLEILEVISL